MDVDARLTRGSSLTELEDLLLAGTPLDVINAYFEKRPAEFGYPAHRQRVLFSFAQLAQFPRKPGPKFIFAHIVSPHPPFVFDAHGRPVDPSRSYTLGDGDDYRGSREEYLRGYAAQVQFVNRQVEAVIDTILSNSRTPPVIVIQGDHGPGSSLDWDTPDRTCLWERTSILNAYYLPGKTTEALYPSISPVNTFRLVLNTYFDTGLNLLPDHTYYTSHRLPRRFIEITTRRDSTQNCSHSAGRTP
jgi:hypothetical protein